jgi:hypothetical protein
MATVGNLAPIKGEIFTTAHVASMSRADLGYYVVSGCDPHEKGSPGMFVTVDAGVVIFNGGRVTVAGSDVVIAAAHATLPRFDVIYVDTSGVAQVAAGTAAAIGPAGATAFRTFTSPFPTISVPAGPILAIVHVRAATTSILNADINDIASFGWNVGVTTVGGLVQILTGTPGKLPILDGSNLTLVPGMRPYCIEFQFDGAGLVIGTGYRPGLEVPVAGNITSARLISSDNTSGSISVQVYKSTYANTPATLSLIDTFGITTATKSEETGLSLAVAVGDWITPNIVSCTSLKYVTLSMTVTI